MNTNFIDSTVSFDENTDGLVIQKAQYISPEFIAQLQQERFQNSQQRVPNEYHRVASIPVVVVEKWLTEGFDIYKEDAKAILARLKHENLDYFITSDKV